VPYINNGQRKIGQIVVDERIADDIFGAFMKAYESGFHIESVVPLTHPGYQFRESNEWWSDELSMAANNTSGFNLRTITNDPDRLSPH